MNKVKVHFVAIASLIGALFITMAAAVGAAIAGRVQASAEITPVAYAPERIFASGGVSGEVGASEGEAKAPASGEGKPAGGAERA